MKDLIIELPDSEKELNNNVFALNVILMKINKKRKLYEYKYNYYYSNYNK